MPHPLAGGALQLHLHCEYPPLHPSGGVERVRQPGQHPCALHTLQCLPAIHISMDRGCFPTLLYAQLARPMSRLLESSCHKQSQTNATARGETVEAAQQGNLLRGMGLTGCCTRSHDMAMVTATTWLRPQRWIHLYASLALPELATSEALVFLPLFLPQEVGNSTPVLGNYAACLLLC